MNYPQNILGKKAAILTIIMGILVISGFIFCNLSYSKDSKYLMSKTYDMGYFKDIMLEDQLKASTYSVKDIPVEKEFDPNSVNDKLFTITITGNKKAVENIKVRNADHVLILSKIKKRNCSVCKNNNVQIHISYIDNPDLEKLLTPANTQITP